MNDDVCVATMSWARDDAEERLLRGSLRALAGARLPVALADNGTSAAFTTFVESLPGFMVTVPANPSLITQVQASLRRAAQAGRNFILYTESDKERFFKHGLQAFLSAAPRTDDVGVVLAARSASSFATFPPFQRFTEQAINEVWAHLTGENGDYSYGPMLLNRELVPHVDGVAAGIGWGWRHFMVGVARHLGYRVVQIEGDHPCPPGQDVEGDAERVHRLRQLSENVQGVILGMTLPSIDRADELRPGR